MSYPKRLLLILTAPIGSKGERTDTITLAGAVICLLLFLTGCVTVLAPPRGLPGESGEEQLEAKTYEVGQEGPAGEIIVYRNPDGDSS